MKLVIAVICSIYVCGCNSFYYPTEESGRVKAAMEKLHVLCETKIPSGHTEPVVRKPRQYKWSLDSTVEEDEHTTMTVATPFPITKSPQQIQQEMEAEMRRKNPKNVFFHEYAEEKQIKEIVLGTTVSHPIDLSIKDMGIKLKNLQTSCATNSDCTNTTCCMIGGDGKGRCVLKPHRSSEECSDMCPCVNDLHCKLTEINQEKPGDVKFVRKCTKKPLDENSNDYLIELKNALKELKGCVRCKNKKN